MTGPMPIVLLLKYFDVYKQRLVFIGSGLFNPKQTVREFLLRVRSLLIKRGHWDETFMSSTQAGKRYRSESSSWGYVDTRVHSGLEAWEERLVTMKEARIPVLKPDATIESCLQTGDIVVVQPMLTSAELNILKADREQANFGCKPDDFCSFIKRVFCVSVPMVLRQLCARRTLVVRKSTTTTKTQDRTPPGMLVYVCAGFVCVAV